MSMEVRFPGGLKVEAVYRGQVIPTDQPEHAGGEGTAPAPFDLFLASIATCAGLYALTFCQQRGLATEGLALTLETVRDPEEHHRIGRIELRLQLPEGFPEKYHPAIVRAMDQCAVKRHIVEAPEFAIEVAAPVAEPA
jgi:ribosomal protein S12 methylthiotransferase accessory factor